MNKLQLYKELLEIAKALKDPKIIKEVGEQMANSIALTDEKRIEVDNANKTIEAAKITVSNIKSEQDKLDNLKQHQEDLNKQDKDISAKEQTLNDAKKSHAKDKSELKSFSESLDKRDKEMAQKEKEIDAALETLGNKKKELDVREISIKQREEKHKSFIESIK